MALIEALDVLQLRNKERTEEPYVTMMNHDNITNTTEESEKEEATDKEEEQQESLVESTKEAEWLNRVEQMKQYAERLNTIQLERDEEEEEEEEKTIDIESILTMSVKSTKATSESRKGAALVPTPTQVSSSPEINPDNNDNVEDQSLSQSKLLLQLQIQLFIERKLEDLVICILNKGANKPMATISPGKHSMNSIRGSFHDILDFNMNEFLKDISTSPALPNIVVSSPRKDANIQTQTIDDEVNEREEKEEESKNNEDAEFINSNNGNSTSDDEDEDIDVYAIASEQQEKNEQKEEDVTNDQEASSATDYLDYKTSHDEMCEGVEAYYVRNNKNKDEIEEEEESQNENDITPTNAENDGLVSESETEHDNDDDNDEIVGTKKDDDEEEVHPPPPQQQQGEETPILTTIKSLVPSLLSNVFTATANDEKIHDDPNSATVASIEEDDLRIHPKNLLLIQKLYSHLLPYGLHLTNDKHYESSYDLEQDFYNNQWRDTSDAEDEGYSIHALLKHELIQLETDFQSIINARIKKTEGELQGSNSSKRSKVQKGGENAEGEISNDDTSNTLAEEEEEKEEDDESMMSQNENGEQNDGVANDDGRDNDDEVFQKGLKQAEDLLEKHEMYNKAVAESAALVGGNNNLTEDVIGMAASTVTHQGSEMDDGEIEDRYAAAAKPKEHDKEAGYAQNLDSDSLDSDANNSNLGDTHNTNVVEQNLPPQSSQKYDHSNDVAANETSITTINTIRKIGHGHKGELEQFSLPIIFPAFKTGFEPTKDLILEPGMVVAGQYLVESELGSAAFSTAYRCVDIAADPDDYYCEVCLKVIKNTKDFFDQSLDEIKVLELLRQTGECEEKNIVEMRSFFYYKEHLIIVTELLRQNLFEFGKFIMENDEVPYFTLTRLSYITRQVLIALDYIHSMGLIHSDVKPENILIASYSRARVKLIDFGSSCFNTDRQSSYIQSRSYRAPEVILGFSYDGKIDIWSLGCVVAEMFTGQVTFQNRSVVSMLSRIEAICGAFPRHIIANGKHCSKYFTPSGLIYERVRRRRRRKRNDNENHDEEEDYNEYEDDQRHEDSGVDSCEDEDDAEKKEEEEWIKVYRPKRTTLSERLGFDADLMKRSIDSLKVCLITLS